MSASESSACAIASHCVRQVGHAGPCSPTFYACSECGAPVAGDAVTVADCAEHPLATIKEVAPGQARIESAIAGDAEVQALLRREAQIRASFAYLNVFASAVDELDAVLWARQDRARRVLASLGES